ncbi:unnamed protein product, partial [Prorocentrum cordatum]
HYPTAFLASLAPAAALPSSMVRRHFGPGTLVLASWQGLPRLSTARVTCVGRQFQRLAMSQAKDAHLEVAVRKISGQSLGTYKVPVGQPVLMLKHAIDEAGGPPACDQQLIAGHRVLGDVEVLGQALADFQGALLLVTVEGCPTCKGPCACTLCGCKPQSGLIPEERRPLQECDRCGGHASHCPFCMLRFPSLCALDTHVRFGHADRELEWQGSRLDAHLERRRQPGARCAAMPEQGTFMEACRGGVIPEA